MLPTLISCAGKGKSETTHGTVATHDLPERRRTQNSVEDQKKVTGLADRLVNRPAQVLANTLHNAGPTFARVVRMKA
jgi:hypothetical protein